MLMLGDYQKKLYKEQEQLDKEFNFPKIETDFNLYKIFIGVEIKEGMRAEYLNNIVFTKNFIGRLVSSWSTMKEFSNKNIFYFITDIKPCTDTLVRDNFVKLTEISIATKVRTGENECVIVKENIPEFIAYYSGVREGNPWSNRYLNMELSIIKEKAITLPCWYANFYRKLIIGDKLVKEEPDNYFVKKISDINTEIFTNGECLRFASLFRFKFGRDAIPLWAVKNDDLSWSHVFTYLHGRFYDAGGSYDYNELIKDWIFEYPPFDQSLVNDSCTSVFSYKTEGVSFERLLDIIKK